MSRAKSVLGIAVLFALALSAFGASSASAATSGTTAFTCVADPNGSFFGAHCLTSGPPEKYKHVAIKQDETTTVTATNANTKEETKAARSIILHGVISGVATEVTCPEVHGEGTLENKLEGEEHYAIAEGKLHYTGCVVKKPAEKGCKVAGETVTTEFLVGTTKGKGMAAEIKPKEGTKFTDIKIEGCSIEALNNTFPVSGSVIAEISGATLTSTSAQTTAEGTLKFAGQKAGLDGALTLKGHKKPKEGEEVEPTKPITATTVPFTG